MKKPLLWFATAVLAAALVPVVYGTAMAYGASFLVWDPQFSTYFYDERPAGFAVIVIGLVTSALLAVFAVAAAAHATALTTRQYRSARRAHPDDPVVVLSGR